MPLGAPESLIGPEALEGLIHTASNTPLGCFVEVGVYKGGSAVRLYELAQSQNRLLYLYDTFYGIPYADKKVDSHPAMDFSDGDPDTVRVACPHAIVVAGVFPGSALPMPPIAFAHIDVDNYRCVLECAQYLAPLIVNGGVMWFDDSPCLFGARRAVKELFGDKVQLSPSGKHYMKFGEGK